MKVQTTKPRGSRIDIRTSHHAGFTIFEFLVIMVVSMALIAVGLPAFIQWTKRAQLMGFARATQTRIQVARSEAIKGQFPVVIQPDFAKNEILVFANVDNDPNFSFDPDTTQVYRTVDYEIARLNVPVDREIWLWHPDDASPNGATVIEGLTDTAATEKAVVFLPDGSLEDPGGIHIADSRGNFLSVRVGPAATGQVQIFKYDSSPPWGTPWYDNKYFFPRGRHPTDDVPMWRWF